LTNLDKWISYAERLFYVKKNACSVNDTACTVHAHNKIFEQLRKVKILCGTALLCKKYILMHAQRKNHSCGPGSLSMEYLSKTYMYANVLPQQHKNIYIIKRPIKQFFDDLIFEYFLRIRSRNQKGFCP
jgi:hypothetical protein